MDACPCSADRPGRAHPRRPRNPNQPRVDKVGALAAAWVSVGGPSPTTSIACFRTAEVTKDMQAKQLTYSPQPPPNKTILSLLASCLCFLASHSQPPQVVTPDERETETPYGVLLVLLAGAAGHLPSSHWSLHVSTRYRRLPLASRMEGRGTSHQVSPGQQRGNL